MLNESARPITDYHRSLSWCSFLVTMHSWLTALLCGGGHSLSIAAISGVHGRVGDTIISPHRTADRPTVQLSTVRLSCFFSLLDMQILWGCDLYCRATVILKNFVWMDIMHPFLRLAVLGQNYAYCSRDFVVSTVYHWAFCIAYLAAFCNGYSVFFRYHECVYHYHQKKWASHWSVAISTILHQPYLSCAVLRTIAKSVFSGSTSSSTVFV